MTLDPTKPEGFAELRRLAGIWKAQEGLPGPDVNRLLDAVPALLGLVQDYQATQAHLDGEMLRIRAERDALHARNADLVGQRRAISAALIASQGEAAARPSLPSPTREAFEALLYKHLGVVALSPTERIVVLASELDAARSAILTAWEGLAKRLEEAEIRRTREVMDAELRTGEAEARALAAESALRAQNALALERLERATAAEGREKAIREPLAAWRRTMPAYFSSSLTSAERALCLAFDALAATPSPSEDATAPGTTPCKCNPPVAVPNAYGYEVVGEAIHTVAACLHVSLFAGTAGEKWMLAHAGKFSERPTPPDPWPCHCRDTYHGNGTGRGCPRCAPSATPDPTTTTKGDAP